MEKEKAYFARVRTQESTPWTHQDCEQPLRTANVQSLYTPLRSARCWDERKKQKATLNRPDTDPDQCGSKLKLQPKGATVTGYYPNPQAHHHTLSLRGASLSTIPWSRLHSIDPSWRAYMLPAPRVCQGGARRTPAGVADSLRHISAVLNQTGVVPRAWERPTPTVYSVRYSTYYQHWYTSENIATNNLPHTSLTIDYTRYRNPFFRSTASSNEIPSTIVCNSQSISQSIAVRRRMRATHIVHTPPLVPFSRL